MYDKRKWCRMSVSLAVEDLAKLDAEAKKRQVSRMHIIRVLLRRELAKSAGNSPGEGTGEF
jgi:metal-responsive CopG/Arc/MetJ family transcriptional regulator